MPGERPFDTLPYHPEEITELYFGPAIEAADKDSILELAQEYQSTNTGA